MTLEERVDELQNELRHSKRRLVAVLVAGVIAIAAILAHTYVTVSASDERLRQAKAEERGRDGRQRDAIHAQKLAAERLAKERGQILGHMIHARNLAMIGLDGRNNAMLEAEHQRALAMIAQSLSGGAGAASNTVRAQAFDLVDKKGMIRAKLSVMKGNSTLRLFDEKDKLTWHAP